MPKIKLTKEEISTIEQHQLMQRKREIRTEFIYKQLGQITIALPKQISPVLENKPKVLTEEV
jgi:hypothetical protein